ncbi:non-classical arabinogalactan protein 30-like [Aristolochia californica]|uniref:non-classical arabinogalactan protein 30-like n=1 Tax=Aristolochia californica TaxID=171875 RepID=UPI0035D97A0C
MAAQRLFSFPPLMFFLLLAFVTFRYSQAAEEVAADVVVEGVVYCQSCDRYGSWSLTGAEPLPAAKVGVACKDYNGRVSYYKAFSADQHGYFYAQLQGFKMNHYYLDHPLQACKVHLLSSPHPTCNLMSNVNWGIDGSPLRYENKKLYGETYEAVIYAAGPLAFRPNKCPVKTKD